MIHTHDLSRSFQIHKRPEGLVNSLKGFFNRQYTTKTALFPTTLDIAKGQVVGLVGANGAGKTTLLKLLSGLIHPSSGTATVLGYQPWKRQNQYLKKMSLLLGQKNQLWWDISPSNSFDLLAKIYDIPKQIAKERIDELSIALDCAHVLDIQLRRLSLGERMKMEMIGALLHQPEVIFLDEPTIGLDVVSQVAIRDFLQQYMRKFQPTILLTSHYMGDISELADRLILLSHGRLVYDGTVDGFTEKMTTKNLKDEKTDFEDVIREFLEKESRLR